MGLQGVSGGLQEVLGGFQGGSGYMMEILNYTDLLTELIIEMLSHLKI